MQCICVVRHVAWVVHVPHGVGGSTRQPFAPFCPAPRACLPAHRHRQAGSQPTCWAVRMAQRETSSRAAAAHLHDCVVAAPHTDVEAGVACSAARRGAGTGRDTQPREVSGWEGRCGGERAGNSFCSGHHDGNDLLNEASVSRPNLPPSPTPPPFHGCHPRIFPPAHPPRSGRLGWPCLAAAAAPARPGPCPAAPRGCAPRHSAAGSCRRSPPAPGSSKGVAQEGGCTGRGARVRTAGAMS